MQRVDYVTASKIGRLIFGCGIIAVQNPFKFTVAHGIFRLHISREYVIPNQVYCRLDWTVGTVGQALGSFYYDTELERLSVLCKEL